MAEQFKHLFSPLKIGAMTVPNRIFSPPHSNLLGEPDQLPGPRQIAYWESKAKGGVGLIGTQNYPFHRSHSAGGLIVFNNPDFVPRFRKLADVLHQYGTKVMVQLHHAGRQSRLAGLTSTPVVSPSATTVRPEYETPHVLDEDEIWDIIRAYPAAAVKAREAGIDGVEIHMAHGYLIQQFMSPLTNLRDDQWGGSWENRLRFALETINAVRAAVGKDYTVGIRLSGDEFTDGGYTIEDMKKVAPILAGTGKIDYISVSNGTYVSFQVIFPTSYYPLGFGVFASAAIKPLVDIPVFIVGRINDPVQAEQIIADNQADVVAMNRATICDPELPNKARQGRLEEIRRCIGCLDGCFGALMRGGGITCAQNVTVSRELMWSELKPAAVKKKVVVVGGGVAGLETARIAASRGHQVVLIEKGSELGGQVNIAAKAPGREDFTEVGRWYTVQMRLQGVEVMLNTEATADTILSMNPDAVVIATGSKGAKPNVPGADQPNVVHARDVLTGKANVGDNVLVVALEHYTIGATCADFLASRGKKVEIINEEIAIAHKANPPTWLSLMARLDGAGVVQTPRTMLRRIDGNTVTVYNAFSGKERTIENIDTVVIAEDGRADDSLKWELKGRVKELHLAGHALSPRRMYDCIVDGAELGRAL